MIGGTRFKTVTFGLNAAVLSAATTPHQGCQEKEYCAENLRHMEVIHLISLAETYGQPCCS